MDKKSPIIKLNQNMMRLVNLLEQNNRELRRLRDDVDIINSYIKELKEIKDKENEVKDARVEEINKGWFWS